MARENPGRRRHRRKTYLTANFLTFALTDTNPLSTTSGINKLPVVAVNENK